jgi:hypothetical protein
MVCLLTWFKFWKEALVAVVGAVSGVVGVGLFFSAFGRFEAFRKSVSYLTALEQGKWHSPYAILVYPSDDVGVAIMIALLGILSFYYWRHPISGSARWLGLGWGIIILMPCMMFARGAFPMMYFYMVIIPVSLAILQLSQQALSSPRGRHLALAITVIMGMLCLGGLPARLYTSWKDWEFRNPQHMRDFVRTYVHPDDAVFSDYPFYFELRDYAKFVAMPAYRWVVPPDEARQINVAIVRDKDMPDLTRDASGLEGIGGGWKKVAVFPTPEMQSTGRKGPDGATFTLYRRDPAAP